MGRLGCSRSSCSSTISALNPTYMEPLFKETFGRVLLVAAAVMVVTGSLVIKRIVNIKL